MKRRFRGPSRRRVSTGTALVLTLFFVLLISALVVALLISMRLDRSNTQGYYQSVRVQELASGAMEEIFSDLKCEIAAGSRQEDVFTVNGKTIYVPTSALSSQPARYGYAPGTNGDYATDIDAVRIPPTLIRVSRANIDTNLAFPPANYDQAQLPPARASAVSSTNYSFNGRTISPKRWNSSFLLSGSAAPPTKFASQPPEWIYVTRGGSRVLANSDIPSLKPSDDLDATNSVLGRYSYILYDEGGLLDINVAGYPSTLTSGTIGPAAIRGKSSALYAALASLPGLNGKTNEINALVNWRGQGSVAAASGDYVTAANNWAKHGFLQMTNGDSPLLSRKDLIDYFNKKVGTTAPLPYLSTFSRYLAAPSTRPAIPSDASSGYYNETKFDTTGTNRDLANVRFSAAASVSHYADDATSKAYEVKEGDPLLQSRFSLARLDWLQDANPETGSSPSASRAAAIKSCFGLVWGSPGGAGSSTMANGGNKCWNYVGAKGDLTNPPGTIKTLDEVASEGREPDFFELLKATILSGSLGRSPGNAAFNNGKNVEGFNKDYYYPWGDDSLKNGVAGFYAHTFGPASSVPVPARIPDMQIIRIGANIIDQYDADSYPTAIYFRYQGVGANDPVGGASANPIFGPAAMAFGIENLPYLQAIRQILASPDRSSTGTPGQGTDLAVDTFAGWRQPYLWNPHQPPKQTLQNRPASYQIRAYGSPCMTKWQWSGPAAIAAGKNYEWGLSPSVEYFESNSNGETCAVGTIDFTIANSTSPSAFCFYDKPYPLVQDVLPGLIATSPEPGNLGKSSMAFYNENIPDPYNFPNHFVGFSTGVTSHNDPGVGSPYRPFYVSDAGGLTGQGRPEVGTNTYILGWIDSSSGFHPYSYLTGVFTFEGFKLEGLEQRVGSANPDRGTETWIQADPRTERFSLARGLQSYQLTPSLTVYGGNNQRWHPCARPRTEMGFVGTGYPWQTYSFAVGDMMVNSTTDAVHTNYYSDPDGVVRPGDGYYATPATGDGLMTFVTNGAPTGSPLSSTDQTSSQHARRPVILNRPFRSVAELGYVFRDMPFKTLDFFSAKSADTALLDVFCLNDVASVGANGLLPIAAGRCNPNAAPVPVLKALLQGGAKKEADANYNIQNESENLAKAIASKFMRTSSFVPANGYRELVPALVDALRTAATTSADKGNKTYLEAPLRAMSESTDMRTWNLMVDLITQSGQISPTAKTLSDFVVQAECRIWLHIAIDRYTGEVVARQIEPVYE